MSERKGKGEKSRGNPGRVPGKSGGGSSRTVGTTPNPGKSVLSTAGKGGGRGSPSRK